MSENKCKHCGSEKVVKNGRQNNKQRYKCKDCGKVFRETARKYSPEFKMEVVKMHINSVGNRAIARIKNIHHSLVASWIKKMGLVVKEEFSNRLDKIQEKDIAILELDELFTYVKKKRIKCIYLLLLTEKTSELLISK